MNRFLFVLGSNWRLSLAELDNYLRNSQNKGKIIDYSANIAIVEFEILEKDRYYVNKLMEMQFILGGSQKIAKIYDFIDIKTIYEAFPFNIEKYKSVQKTRDKILNVIKNIIIGKEAIFPNVYESMFFAISIYPNLYDEEYYSKILVKHFLPFLNKEIKEILLEKGSEKTLYYQYPEKNIKSGTLNPIFPHHIIKYNLLKENRAEIIFGFSEEGVYIARTFTTDDPNFKRKIDEEKPYKEFKSAISPKLSLILLNFLNLFGKRHNKKILDPFVGNGTIALFGTLQDFQVYSSDNNEQKIVNTRQNLVWLLELLEEEIPSHINKRILKLDARKLSNFFEPEFFDGICTEPELAPFFLEKPYYNQVRDLIDDKLEPLYDQFFSEAYKILKPNCRISLIAPVITTIDGNDVQVNIDKLASKNHFKLIPILNTARIVRKSNLKLQFRKRVLKSILDAKKGQIVKRKIYVLEKN